MAEAVAETTRRDFLYVGTATFAGLGAAAALVPLIAQMNPDASTLAMGGPVDFDTSKLAPGQQAMVFWRSRPIFIINRPASALATLKDDKLVAQLADPNSLQHQQPPYAENPYRSVKPEFAVLVGICTHLGCIPGISPRPDVGDRDLPDQVRSRKQERKIAALKPLDKVHMSRRFLTSKNVPAIAIVVALRVIG
jgi:ubiquinol-cytochrome c reductase iron-sulfur subunit